MCAGIAVVVRLLVVHCGALAILTMVQAAYETVLNVCTTEMLFKIYGHELMQK